MKIRPLQDRVIVRRVKEEEKTKGGLFIPDTAKEKPVEAIVLAVGNGKVLEDGTVRKLDVKPGDRILFGKYSGSEVKIEGEDTLILREEDILGVIEGCSRLRERRGRRRSVSVRFRRAVHQEIPSKWQPKRSSITHPLENSY